MRTLQFVRLDLRFPRALKLAAALCVSMVAGCGGGYGGGGSSMGGACGGAYGGMGMAPTITAQPMSQTVTAGSMVTFSVTATGSAPLSYQWMFNSSNIMNATMASYTITSASAANSGTYAVVVSNACGHVTSSGAMLNVM